MDNPTNTKESGEKDLEKTGPSRTSVTWPDSEEPEVLKETGRISSNSVFVVERVVNGSVCTVKSSRSSFTCEKEEIPKQPVIASSVSKENSQGTLPTEIGVEIVKEITQDCADNSESVADDIQLITKVTMPVIEEVTIEESPPEQESVSKTKKGPPPGLLPLENSGTPNSPEGRVPRKAAIKSAEKIKAMAQILNSAPGKKDIGKQSFGDCNGILRDSLQDHIVIEPDIEIHTLSDEFQMEFEDAEPSHAGNNVPAVVTTDLVEKAARETICCLTCHTSLYDRTDTLLWESMEFCSEKCLKTYVKVIGSHCNMCNSQVGENILGKLCVRFGTVIRQFCTSECLEKFKGSHKLCSNCQVNMSDKDKVHCSPACEELSRRLANKSYFYGRRFCAVCNELKDVQEEVFLKGRSNWLCSKPCLNAFRFSNKVTTISCETCSRGFDLNVTPRFLSRNTNSGLLTHHATLSWYCSSVCFAIHLLRKRRIEFCARCQVKKYNVDMIRKPTGDIVGKTKQDKNQLEAQMLHFCSIYCFTHYMTPVGREAPRRRAIEIPSQPVATSVAPPLAVSSKSLVVESSLRPVPPSFPNLMTPQAPVITRPLMVYNLPASSQVTPSVNTTTTSVSSINQLPPPHTAILPIELQHKIVFVPPKPKEMKNKSVWCRPSSFKENESMMSPSEQSTVCVTEPLDVSKALDIPKSLDVSKALDIPKSLDVPEPPEVVQCEIGTSTDEEKKPLYIPIPIPIPVPIYVPVPMAMYNFPFPFPVGFPIVIPSIFPVGSNFLAEVMKAIEDSKKPQVDNETSLADDHPPAHETVESNNESKSTDEPIPINLNDLEREEQEDSDSIEILDEVNFELEIPSCCILSRSGGRKRSHSASHFSLPMPKRLKNADSYKSSSDSEESIKTFRSDSPSLHVIGGFQKEVGVKAWTEWMKRNGTKKPDISKLCEMSVMDINTSLIAFVQQIKKPDGERYRPDVLLYFITGLQESLSFGADFRRQNLLMDVALLPFQIELDKQLQPFYDVLLKAINSDSTIEVETCLKESHLWKCRQLGVDSPIVLVFTMLYFNTKYFRLYTAEQHLEMSFRNVQNVVKKTVASTLGVSNGSSSKNAAKIFSLQFEYFKTEKDRDADLTRGIRRKKALEMPQNVDDLKHCPVKIHNFYVSKCPEESKSRKDMFYLLPDPSCAPDSPVWYSSQPVPREILARMLRRVLLVEEVLHNLCSLD